MFLEKLIELSNIAFTKYANRTLDLMHVANTLYRYDFKVITVFAAALFDNIIFHASLIYVTLFGKILLDIHYRGRI